MPRYIDADKIKYKHKSNTSNTGGNNSMNYVTKEDIDNIPTADVQEVKHGEWLDNGANYKCSICGNVESYYSDSYCRVCGAKMDGDE